MAAFGSANLPGTGGIVDRKYKLERLIGKGGMGAVYAARHITLGNGVAIKLMLAEAGNLEATQRFINEGRAAANIQSEHVARVSDVGEENGYAFMVLELLDGEDLDQLLEREIRLAPGVAANYVMQGLKGVGEAHARGIVHRDLKPANLFLARRPDGSAIVKVLDFGISKTDGGSALAMAPNQLTSTATMLGSPLYMSPEQLRSSKKVDARADIWAMGVILFELITGVRPFDGETLGELFSSILETEAPRLSSRIPSVPPGLDAIVARCLQRRPEDRYQTVAELERDLAPFTAMTAPTAGSPLAFSAFAQPSHLPPTTGARSAVGSTGAAGAVTGTQGPYGLQPGPAVNPMSPPVASNDAAMAYSSPAIGITPNPPPNPPIVQGTVPLGAMTPQPKFQQTTGSGSAWQSGGPPPKTSNATLAFLLVCGLLGLTGIGLFVARYAVKGHKPEATIASQPSASAPLPTATVSSTASAASSVAVAVVPSTPPSAASSAPLAAVAPTTKPRVVAAPVSPKVDPPKVDPPKVDPPKVDPPKTAAPPPRPPPSSNNGPQQQVR